MTSSELELVPLAQDTARFVDRRIGLSICIPGHPQLLPVAASAGVSEPAYEARIALADAPISIRYRHTAGAAGNAPLYVETYAANRCRPEERPRAQAASPEQRSAWGVDAAASTLYALREPDADGGDMEEALVLARGDAVVVLTKRFPRAQTSWIAWTLANSAIAAGICWDPAALAAPPAPLWPRSSFLAPGITGALAPGRRDAAARLAARIAAHPASAVRLADGAGALVRGSEPPAHVVTASERAMFETYLADLASDPALGRELSALVAEVETAHDLRGLCLLVLHATGRIQATFAPSGDDARRAFDYLTE
ncbi:MAG: hypothetical protein ACM31C_19595 [Acidobacteriota bacterium]